MSRAPLSLGLRRPRGFRGRAPRDLLSWYRLGLGGCRAPPRGGRSVSVTNHFVNRDMLSLDPVQVSDPVRVATSRDIEDLAGNDEVPEEFEELRAVGILDAAKNRQMEPEVGIDRVAAGSISASIDRNAASIWTRSSLVRARRRLPTPRSSRPCAIPGSAVRPCLTPPHRDRCGMAGSARPAARTRQGLRGLWPGRPLGAPRPPPAPQFGRRRRQREFLLVGRRAPAQPAAENLGGRPPSQFLGSIERRAKP